MQRKNKLYEFEPDPEFIAELISSNKMDRVKIVKDHINYYARKHCMSMPIVSIESCLGDLNIVWKNQESFLLLYVHAQRMWEACCEHRIHHYIGNKSRLISSPDCNNGKTIVC